MLLRKCVYFSHNFCNFIQNLPYLLEGAVKESYEKSKRSFKRFAKYFILNFIYLSLGSFLFFYTEHCYSVYPKQLTSSEQKLISICNTFSHFKTTLNSQNCSPVIESTLNICQDVDAVESKKCEYSYSNFIKWYKYSSSVVYTIGYGDVLVDSDFGKILTIVFAVPGFALAAATYINAANGVTSVTKVVVALIEMKYFHRSVIKYWPFKVLFVQLFLSFVLLLMMAFSHTLTHTENLTFLNGFYFAFVTSTTIGFGDYAYKLERYVTSPVLLLVTTMLFHMTLGMLASVVSSLMDLLNEYFHEKPVADKHTDEEDIEHVR